VGYFQSYFAQTFVVALSIILACSRKLQTK